MGSYAISTVEDTAVESLTNQNVDEEERSDANKEQAASTHYLHDHDPQGYNGEMERYVSRSEQTRKLLQRRLCREIDLGSE